MKILSLYAEEFGCLSDRLFEFGEGLNIIEGENESGKSTMLSLLRFLFYGFPRKNSTDGEERERALSRTGRRAAGSVTLQAGGTHYTVTRTYLLHGTGGRELPLETLSVVHTESGKKVDIGSKSVGEYLFSLPLELYRGSMFAYQGGIDGVANAGTAEALGDLLFGGDGKNSAQNAEKLLQNARRELQHLKGRGGRVSSLEDECAALDEEIAAARRESEALHACRAEHTRLSANLAERRHEVEETERLLLARRTSDTLAVYDRWHAAKREAEAARADYERALAEKTAKAQYRDQITTARGLLRDTESAAEGVRFYREEQKRLSGVEFSDKLLNGAEELARVGGCEQVARALEKRASAIKKHVAIGSAFLPFAVLLLVLGTKLPWLFAAAAVSLLATVFCYVRAVQIKNSLRATLCDFGVLNVSLLSQYAEQCEREKARYDAHTAALGELSEKLAQSEEQLTILFEALCAALGEVGAHPTSLAEAAEYLRGQGDLSAEADVEALTRYEKARSAADALAVGLDLAAEAGLREKLASLPLATEDEDTLLRRLSFAKESQRALTARVGELAREEAALGATVRDVSALSAARDKANTALREARASLAAVNVALEALGVASETLQSSVMPEVAKRAGAIFSELTAGAYSTLLVSEALGVSVKTESGVYPLSQFSAGCRDAAYFALRLALLETVTDEPLPLLLDEVTAHLDDKRAAALLSVLSRYTRGGGQCLLFTCHTREAALLRGEEFVKISLSAG